MIGCVHLQREGTLDAEYFSCGFETTKSFFFFGKWGQMSAFTGLAKWILVGNHRASSAPPVDGWGWDGKKRKNCIQGLWYFSFYHRVFFNSYMYKLYVCKKCNIPGNPWFTHNQLETCRDCRTPALGSFRSFWAAQPDNNLLTKW